MITEITAVAAPITGKPIKFLLPAKDMELLVHDGKSVIVRHGAEAHTGSGNTLYTMITGTKIEIEAEIASLKLTTPLVAVSTVSTVKPK